MLKPLAALLGITFVTFTTCLATAQESAPVTAPAAPATAPAPDAQAHAMPDLVRLTNGGMLRGTIAEFVPGEYVVIVTLTGEAKRLPASEISYAGPAAQDPSVVPAPLPVPAAAPAPVATTATPEETKPLITVKANSASIHFDAAPPPPKADGSAGVAKPLTLYLRTGTATAVGSGGVAVADSFSRVCTAPCDAELAEGSYTFGLGEGDTAAKKIEDVLTVKTGDTLIGHYQSRRGMRIAGWVVIGAGFAVGAPVMFSSAGGDSSNAGLIGGAVLMGVGSIVGLIMSSRPDVAKIEKR